MTVLFLLRRLGLAVCTIFIKDNAFFQMLYLQVSSFAILIYLIKFQPMDDSKINIFEIINEICLLLCGTVIISFTDYNINAVDWIGWVYVGITGLLIVYTIISVVAVPINLIWQKIKEKWDNKARKEQMGPQKIKPQKKVQKNKVQQKKVSQKKVHEKKIPQKKVLQTKVLQNKVPVKKVPQKIAP
jgi:hypothetical protein